MLMMLDYDDYVILKSIESYRYLLQSNDIQHQPVWFTIKLYEINIFQLTFLFISWTKVF